MSGAELTALVLALLPPGRRYPLLTPAGAGEPGHRLADPDWVAGRVQQSRRLWRTADRRVLTVLWWYSAATVLLAPTTLSLLLTGRALSPGLDRLTVFSGADGLLSGIRSAAVCPGDPGPELRASLVPVIAALTAVAGGTDRAFWALTADALADRLLFAADSVRADGPGARPEPGRRAVGLADALAASIGPVLPRPRFVEVGPPPAGTTVRRLVDRQSCCLIYRIPDGSLCVSCPRRHPEDRAALLGTPRPTRGTEPGPPVGPS